MGGLSFFQERARSMLNAPQFDDPEYWHQRAEKARVLADQMSNELHKEMMLKVADNYDQLAVKAAVRSINERKRS